MMSPEEYIESMKAMKFRTFILGERVESVAGHPLVILSRNAVAMTYFLAQDPECGGLGAACSHLTGRTVNRFTHIHQNTEDLVNKIKMQRLLGQMTGTFSQRCVGMDAINAISSTTI